MELVFVDESYDNKYTDYFGICVAAVNSSKYPSLKSSCHQTLQSHGWDLEHEFKGSHIFSAKKGDTTVEPEARISIADELLANSTSSKNARVRFHYAVMTVERSQSGAAFSSVVPRLVRKVLKPAEKTRDKNLVAVMVDERSDVQPEHLRAPLRQTLDEAGYVLFEDVFLVRSGIETVGLLYADLVAYLAARIDVYSKDPALYREQPELIPQNRKLWTLQAAGQLIERVKALDHEEIRL